jgi:hypothetical protein
MGGTRTGVEVSSTIAMVFTFGPVNVCVAFCAVSFTEELNGGDNLGAASVCFPDGGGGDFRGVVSFATSVTDVGGVNVSASGSGAATSEKGLSLEVEDAEELGELCVTCGLFAGGENEKAVWNGGRFSPKGSKTEPEYGMNGPG